MTGLARAVPLVLVAVASLAACSKKPPAVTPAPAPVQSGESDADRARREAMERADALRRDSLAREEQMRRDRDRRAAEARTTIMAMIYFDYDRAELSREAQTILDQKLPILSANPAMRIRVSGHTDERGSDEYNLALGQRRAAAAKRYLVQRGISADRIETVSFGEERPIAQGGEESAWSQNRRDEFEIIIGGEVIVTPE